MCLTQQLIIILGTLLFSCNLIVYLPRLQSGETEMLSTHYLLV